MSTAARLRPVPVDEYLDGENHFERKHEYIVGVIYAMVGTSYAHNLVATNVTGLLHSQLRGKNCRVFNADAKVRVQLPSGTRFYYPDASVVCQPNRPEDTFNDAPVVIIEVPSESTRRTLEHEKREAYAAIDSLLVYVLLEQDSAAPTLTGLGQFLDSPKARQIEAKLGIEPFGGDTEMVESNDVTPAEGESPTQPSEKVVTLRSKPRSLNVSVIAFAVFGAIAILVAGLSLMVGRKVC